MYKPAKHVGFDADKREDKRMMIRLNAVAMSRGLQVAVAARFLLENAIDAQAPSVADRNEDSATRLMWPR